MKSQTEPQAGSCPVASSQTTEHAGRIRHLKGTPFEIGYAMGRSLGPRLDANIARYVRQRVSGGTPFDPALWRSGALPWLRTLPARFQDEFEGLAQGANLPLQRLAEWAYLEVLLSGRCSGAIIALADQVWVARNNDSFAPDMWGYVTIREVSGRIPAISFGLEGDVFTPTGINQEQLWLHYNYLPAWDAPVADRPHLPCYALMVEALETCRTLQDLERLLARVQRDDGMLLFAVEGRTNTYALYECTCTGFYKLAPARGWLVGTNHYRVHPAAPPLTSSGPLSTTRRYDRMELLLTGLVTGLVTRLVAQGPQASPVQELIRILADDAIEARSGPLQTVYSNVACPHTHEIWYTLGGYPAASRGNWQPLEWPWR